MPHDFPQANKIDVVRHSPADINILKEVLVWDRKEEALGTLPPIHTHTHIHVFYLETCTINSISTISK